MPKKKTAAAKQAEKTNTPTTAAASTAAVKAAAAEKTAAPKKPTLEDRLVAIENALAAGFNVNLELYDTAKIVKAREKTLADAAEQAKQVVADAVAEARAVNLTDTERIERLETAIGAALGLEI